MRVLLVDDISIIRFCYAEVLLELGHEVLEAGNGREALEVFRENPDIGGVLCDVRMPLMNGDELHREIRVELAERNVIFVAHSAACSRAVKEYFEAQGVPFESKEAPVGMDSGAFMREIVLRHFSRA